MTHRSRDPLGGPGRIARQIERIYKAGLARIRSAASRARLAYRPDGRRWQVDLPLHAIQSIQQGALRYSHRGLPMLKNPFDLALYQLLLWKCRPATIIEIGSYLGASALWLADVLRVHGINGKVISIDIKTPSLFEERSDVVFLKGDAHSLHDVLTPEMLKELPRPLMVFEDSTHASTTTRMVLDFFAAVLEPGEYIVVEDGIVTDLGRDHHYAGGPGHAVSAFLKQHPEFAIDAEFCDFYGHNFTGNPNGYLRRL